MPRKFLAALIIVAASNCVWAQQVELKWPQHSNGRLLSDLIADIEQTTPLVFFYDPGWIKDLRVMQREDQHDLRTILKQTLASVKLDILEIESNILVIVEEQRSTERDQKSTARHLLSGVIKDSDTGRGIAQAFLFFPSIKKEIQTGDDGKFQVELNEGHHLIVLNAPGFAEIQRSVRLFADMNFDIEMYEKLIELQEVEVSAASMDQALALHLGSQQISTEALRKIPPLLGERDLIRSILSMPGVKTVGEGASGFNVRGGNVDQNLLLIDNAPVFNSSHLLGLFSIIDADVIQSVSLHKGAMPARYGGRLSSALDITLADNMDIRSTVAEAGVGVMSSKVKVATPLARQKTVLSLSARGAYPNWLLAMMPDVSVKQSSAQFYDATAKLSHRVNDKHKVTLTSHYTMDQFRLGRDTTYKWSGLAASAQLLSRYSDTRSADFSVFISESRNNADAQRLPNPFELRSWIRTYGLRYELNLRPTDEHDVSIGMQSSAIQVNRGTLEPLNNESSILSRQLPEEKGIESAMYVSDVVDLNSFLSFSTGLRISNFLYLSNGFKNTYEPGVPRNEFSFIEREHTSKGSIERSFFNVEPRFSLKLSLNQRASIRAGASRNFQYLTLLSNSAAVSPIDTWKLTDSFLRPQRSDMFSIGYFTMLQENAIEISVEGYYKTFSNITQYKPGTRLVMNETIEQALLQGDGRSYGSEFYLKKNEGRLTGWLSYTYSRTFMRVKGNSPEETLAEGAFYPANFDKPHDISLLGNYEITKRFSASASFVYNTGRPATYPESIYVMDGFLVANYSAINQHRTPDYHRLDVSFTHSMLPKKNRKVETSWSLGAYNIYARRNPYSVFFRPEFSGRYPQAYRLSVLGSIIPYFTMNFKLKK